MSQQTNIRLDASLKAQAKAAAALAGVPFKQWLEDAIRSKLEEV